MSTPAGAPIPPDAYAIIIGSMKSGTTSLFSYLAANPQICPASIKEPEYFSRNQRHRAELARYEDLWDFDPAVHRWAMEASTGYTKAPLEQGVPQRMREHPIDPHLIYLMRDPVARIASHYRFMSDKDRWELAPDDPHLLAVSNYYLQLQQYEGVFPRERLLLLEFDDLRADPAGLITRVSSFLDIDPVLPESFAIENETRLKSSWERRVRSTALGEKVAKSLGSGSGGSGLKKALRRKPKATAGASLTDEQKASIREQLAPDMLRLRDEYGVDVARWGFA